MQDNFHALEQVSFPGMSFHLFRRPDYAYMQIEFQTIDTAMGGVVIHKGRKWLLSQHMTRSEVVQTALKAVLTVLEHEARENFKYRGAAIFGPHFDVDALSDIRAEEMLDMRQEVANG